MALFAASGWLAISIFYLKYREPPLFMLVFAVLLASAAFATAPGASNTRYIIKERPVAAAQRAEHSYTIDAVTSADGTKIGYRRIGQGPGLILVQGAMGSAQNYDELARTLADNFTVYLPDRRGRGMSPRPYSPEHSIQRDVEDLNAVMMETGATDVYGLSSGAVIVIEACRTLPGIRKATLYEPPFYLDGMPLHKVAGFHEEAGQERLNAALVTAGTIVGLGPAS